MADRFDPAERRKVLGCSEIAQALGFSPWGTAEEKRLEKVGRKLPEPESGPMRRGKDMEPLTRRLYMGKTGRILHSMEEESHDPKRPWLVCHVDALISREEVLRPDFMPMPDGAAGDGIFEGKAPGSNMAKIMGENGLTPDYIHQGMGMLHVTGREWCGFAFLDYDAYDVVTFDVKRDAEFIGLMLAALDKFWWHVQNDEPLERPQLVDPASVPVIRGEKEIIDDPAIVAIAADFIECNEAYKDAEAFRKAAQDKLRAVMEPYALAEIGGILRVSNKPGDPKEVVDADALWAYCMTSVPKFTLIADKFKVIKPGVRTMRPTPVQRAGGR